MEDPKTKPSEAEAAMVSIPQSSLDELMNKLAKLEARVDKSEVKTQKIDPNKPPVLPVWSKKPPEKGHVRIRIKTARGIPVAPKVTMVDDVTDPSDPIHRCVGPLHKWEVVDVPQKVFDNMRSREGVHLADLDLIETTDKPSTRPFAYEDEGQCRLFDPRFKRTEAETRADVDRVRVTMQQTAASRARAAK